MARRELLRQRVGRERVGHEVHVEPRLDERRGRGRADRGDHGRHPPRVPECVHALAHGVHCPGAREHDPGEPPLAEVRHRLVERAGVFRRQDLDGGGLEDLGPPRAEGVSQRPGLTRGPGHDHHAPVELPHLRPAPPGCGRLRRRGVRRRPAGRPTRASRRRRRRGPDPCRRGAGPP